MTELPAELAYGRVVGRWVLPVADDPTAPETSPAKRIPTGKVNFVRLDVSAIALDGEQADGTYVGIVRKKITAELDGTGEMFLEGQAGPGFLLAEGAYQVEPAFSEVNWPSFPIVVTAAHTSEAPLDVLKSSPILPSPTVIAAPSLETAERAEAAAASASVSETSAEASADEAMSSELASAANASSAAGSAAAASLSEAAASNSAAAASGSAAAASGSAAAASGSATAASGSATSASGSVLAAAGSADAAAGSASAAAASSAEAQTWVGNHEAAADPHSQYLTTDKLPEPVTSYSDLSDVDVTGLADGDAMVWDQASGKWVRVSPMSTYAPIPTGTPDGSKFYRDDDTWAVPAGSGGATIAIFDDGTGGLILSSDTALTDDGSGGVTITI